MTDIFSCPLFSVDRVWCNVYVSQYARGYAARLGIGYVLQQMPSLMIHGYYWPRRSIPQSYYMTREGFSSSIFVLKKLILASD